MLLAAALSGIALGFTPPQPVCDANLVFVGTVVELTSFWLPSAAGGPPQLATRVSLTVDRVVRDTVGDTAGTLRSEAALREEWVATCGD